MQLSDLIAGRGLAWLGGIATSLGIVLFLALAISHGWIGEEMRVGLAGAASAALVLAGAWLHDHRGRTEAAVTMVAAGTVGGFATMVVAGDVYQLIPALLAVAGSVLVGTIAAILAIRWAGQAIGAIGLLGALLSPILVGATTDGATIAILAAATASAMWVVVWRRWRWLELATPVIAALQWVLWINRGQSVAADAAVLVVFTAIGLGGAIGTQVSCARERLGRSSAALLVLNASIVAIAGYNAVRNASGITAAELWLVLLAATHIALGMVRSDRLAIAAPARQLLVAIGVVLADVAFSNAASGLLLTVGWGATAVGFAWLTRRTAHGSTDENLLGLGLGAHIGLMLIRVMVVTPPSELGTGEAQIVQLLTVSVLAASCLASARLTRRGRQPWRTALDGLGLAAIAYLTATAMTSPGLVVAWAVEAAALARLHRRTGDDVARFGAVGFLGSALLLALATEAPPNALLTGASSLPAAAVALGAMAIAIPVAGTVLGEELWSPARLRAASASVLLYLASIAIVTAFQPAGGAAPDTVLDLSVRQQGQVLLSGLWSVVGLGALVLGLRTNSRTTRIAGLSLLLLAVGKVFLYDLSTLTSIYRVISFTVLGLLLLTAAFAYQRLRPPPQPDMRTLHPSQR